MASIKKRKVDGKWRARYRDFEGKEHAQHFDLRVDAEQWLDRIRGQLVEGTYVSPAGGQQLFKEFATAWQAAQVHRDSTAAQVAIHLRRHIMPTFGSRRLVSIRPSEVQAWVRGLSNTLKPSTVEVIYTYFATIMRAAVEDRLISNSPCRKVKLPEIHKARIDPLATEVVHQIIDTVPDRYRALVVLAASTGMRQGECFGLTVPHVDFLNKVVRVEQQLVTVTGDPKLSPPKTKASRRSIPLPAAVSITGFHPRGKQHEQRPGCYKQPGR